MKQSDIEKDSFDKVEHIDSSLWTPVHEEKIPAAQLLNNHVRIEGKRYIATQLHLLDMLLESRLIDESYYGIALRLVNLFRLATSKQNYATMQIFGGGYGVSNTDFCPMTVFQRITRQLKARELYWIRIVCGIRSCSYETVAENISSVKDVLETVENNLTEYGDQLEVVNSFHEDYELR